MSKKTFSAVSRRQALKGGLAAAVALPALPHLPRAAFAGSSELNIYNWDTYIGPDTVENFAAETGMKVQYDLFANNEEMFAKLKDGNPGYDLIFPSDYMVEIMAGLGLLMPVDHSKVPNLKHIDPDPNFSSPAYNPGLKFGPPYFWGTMGLGYRKSVMDKPTSWSVLFEHGAQHENRIALIADQRAMLGFALKFLGYSLNSTDAGEIAEARDLLISIVPLVKTFAPDSGQDLLLSGEVDICVEWNGDVLQVMAEDDDLDYVVPDEGGILWQDAICIPAGGPNPDNAHTFINYMLDPKVNASVANYIQYPTANISAREFINPDDLANTAIYPSDATIAACENIVDVGDATRLYDDAWTMIRAS